jgi:2-keto-4-pentenoate hydratase/2-oxohepta-3-ene-1,7-dioic acid hydratase in catechol pathway
MTLLDGDIVMTGTPKGVGKINQGEIFTGTVRDGRKTVTSETWQAK